MAPVLRGFFSGFFGFPPFTKTKISKFLLDQKTVDEEPLCGCATEIPIYYKYGRWRLSNNSAAYLCLVGVESVGPSNKEREPNSHRASVV